MVLAIMQAAAAQSLTADAEEAGQAAFFGFIGIAVALVFASKSPFYTPYLFSICL